MYVQHGSYRTTERQKGREKPPRIPPSTSRELMFWCVFWMSTHTSELMQLQTCTLPVSAASTVGLKEVGSGKQKGTRVRNRMAEGMWDGGAEGKRLLRASSGCAPQVRGCWHGGPTSAFQRCCLFLLGTGAPGSGNGFTLAGLGG